MNLDSGWYSFFLISKWLDIIHIQLIYHFCVFLLFMPTKGIPHSRKTLMGLNEINEHIFYKKNRKKR